MNVVVTIGGQGSRLKCISPIDKHLLYYRAHRLIDWAKLSIPDVMIIGDKKTENRKETLQEVSHLEDCLIIDCDIVIPFLSSIKPYDEDALWYFEEDISKYGSIVVDHGRVVESSEAESISNHKCSGLYFVKSVSRLLEKMCNENSIASAMIGCLAIVERDVIRLGDKEDYLRNM